MSICISWTIYHAVTHRAGAGTSGCSNWEQDTMMSQSQLCVMRHLHNITKQLLPWFLISKDAPNTRGKNLSYGIVYHRHKIKISMIHWRYLYFQRIPMYSAPAWGVLVIHLWNVISSVLEKAGPSEAALSATGYILSNLLNSTSIIIKTTGKL